MAVKDLLNINCTTLIRLTPCASRCLRRPKFRVGTIILLCALTVSWVAQGADQRAIDAAFAANPLHSRDDTSNPASDRLPMLAQLSVTGTGALGEMRREVVAEYATEILAQKHAQRLRGSWRDVVKVEPDVKNMTRLYIGPFASREDANDVGAQLRVYGLLYKVAPGDKQGGYTVRLGAYRDASVATRFQQEVNELEIGEAKKDLVAVTVYQVARYTAPEPAPAVTEQSEIPVSGTSDRVSEAGGIVPGTGAAAQVVPGLGIEGLFVEPTPSESERQMTEPKPARVGTTIDVVQGLGLESLFVDEVPLDDDLDEGEPEAEERSKFWSDLTWSGYLKNETAYRFREPRSITKIRNILYLDAQYPLVSNVDLYAAGWAYYDLAYDLFNYDTIAARSERNVEEPLVFVERLDEEKDSPVAEIRELYADIFLEGFDIRIGKQFIVWGVLEGVRIVDEINPVDFRELILPDLLDYRIPLWSLKLDYFRDNSTFELVWIPDLRFHEPAPRGSEWEMLQDVCAAQSPDILCIESTPESWTLEDSEIGVKVDTYLWDTELSFSYLYTWDDFPAVFRAVRVDTTDVPPAFFPTYTRIHMFGTTAVKQLGRYIVKGELAYVTDKYFGTRNTVDRDGNGFLDDDGELQRDHIRWGLGIEFNLWGMDIAPGITQWYIIDHDDAIMQDEYDTSVNIFTRKEFPEQAAVFQFLGIYLVNLEELLLKPKVTFQIDDRLQLGVGLDLFYGRKSDFGANEASQSATSSFNPAAARAQFLGNFHDNDRIFFDFKYSF